MSEGCPHQGKDKCWSCTNTKPSGPLPIKIHPLRWNDAAHRSGTEGVPVMETGTGYSVRLLDEWDIAYEDVCSSNRSGEELAGRILRQVVAEAHRYPHIYKSFTDSVHEGLQQARNRRDERHGELPVQGVD